ncbi:MAG: hypothetical protein Q7U66_13345 [Methylobacter sp.]|nr:hypothetical protein [Methylobacter sp.]
MTTTEAPLPVEKPGMLPGQRYWFDHRPANNHFLHMPPSII